MHRWRSVTSFIIGLAATLAAPTRARETVDWGIQRDTAFRTVWETVDTAYFDPTHGGVDWKGIRKTFEPRLGSIENLHDLRALLQQMLDALGRSHFAIIPREATVFVPEERDRFGTVGLSIFASEDGVYVSAVRDDSAAHRANIIPGDRVLAVEGHDLDGIREYLRATALNPSRQASSLADFVTHHIQASVGSNILLALERADGTRDEVTLQTEAHAGAWSEAAGNFPSQPLEYEASYREPGVAYLRFNAFSPALMAKIRPFLRSLDRSDGLIIDLRGNRGGLGTMASGIAGLLVSEEMTLGEMRLRDGVVHFEVYPQERAFLGPVAVLIDHGSASTSEILAAGLQDAGRARIFGETSAGAALPSHFTTLATGDIFQFAIADVQTPARQVIEGRGVQPDEPVARTPDEVARGHDAALASAIHWLRNQVASPRLTSRADAPTKPPGEL